MPATEEVSATDPGTDGAPGVGRRRRAGRGHGHELRNELIRAGITLLAERGDEQAVTVRGVARLVGVAAPSVYDHFPDGRELILAVVGEAFEHFRTTTLTAVQALDDPARRLRATVAAYLEYATEHPGLYRILFARLAPSEIPEVGRLAAEMWVRLEEDLQAALPEPLEAEQLRSRALWVWVEMHGLASLKPSHPRFRWPSHGELVDQLLSRAGVRPASVA